MDITFIISLDPMTNGHYFIQPMQMVEGALNKNSYKNPELVETLNDVPLTLHMRRTQTTLHEK